LTGQLIHRLAEVAPRLQPELLHRVITVHGLEDCVDLVAQVTPQQLAHDLIGVFQVGWTALYRDVALHAAKRLIEVLKQVRSVDAETQGALNMLRVQMVKQVRAGTPWRAAPASEVIAILDKPAWAALAGLIAEYPVMHAAIAAHESGALTIDASALDWISDNDQLAAVREYLRTLPEALGV
jgi:hypothetical protein